MKLKKIKKLLVTIFSAYLLLFQNTVVVYAVEEPAVPTAPSTPTAPQNTTTPPPQPTSPVAPTLQEATATPTATPTPVQTIEPEEDNTQLNESEENTEESEEQEVSSQSASTASSQNTENPTNELGTGNQSQNGSTSGAIIDTGNSTNTAVVATDANSNLSAGVTDDVNEGATIVNAGNASGSNNSGSATVTENNNSNQVNSANVVNNLNQTTTTGENTASRNTGGDNTIRTGDANTSGTAITSVNTNLEGLAVYEFNIAEDQNGDYVLDFANAKCVSGCGASTKVSNEENGSESENTANLDSAVNNNTFQSNDATIENNLTLASNSGDNEANRNTGGDNSITTGDANVAANALTLANNNISGGVVYAVVNIYGTLVGDIVLPDGSIIPCCFGDTSLANTDNGSGSSNSGNLNTTTNNNLSQFNTADIDNNLSIYANTGDNDISKNTDGNNGVETGEANVVANVVNFVNNNIVGGDWWLVIVNEGGKWIGKILGAPDGTNMYGSEGFAITTNENGEVMVSNSGNGSDSTNTANVNQTTNNNTEQVNNANIVNNLNLSANTGGNAASRNTGGDSNIMTGDANIIANIVNFVNNNIVGTGKLLVTVVNVFGEWFGNFIGPDQVAGNNENSAGVGGVSESPSTSKNQNAKDNDNSGNTNNVLAINTKKKPTIAYSNYKSQVAGMMIEKTNDSEESVMEEDMLSDSSSSEIAKTATAGKKVLKINLTWLILILPLGAIYILAKRKKLALANQTSAHKLGDE